MINMNQFNAVREALVEITSDSIAHQAALDECEALYQELFIGAGSEMKGSDLVEGRPYNDPEISHLLEERARFELDYENAAVFASTSNLTIEEEFLKIVKSRHEAEMENRAIELAMRYDEDRDDRLYDVWEEVPSLLDWMEDHELQNLYHNVCESTYVVLVNYKGEPESEVLLNSVPHLRTFFGKYNYA